MTCTGYERKKLDSVQFAVQHSTSNFKLHTFTQENIKIMMKTFAISLLLVTALIRIETALSSSHLDDEVPTEKVKKPKLKPPIQLPEVTHRVYMDVGE